MSTLNREYFDALYEELKAVGDDGANHINSARIDWTKEEQWGKPSSHVIAIDDNAWAFFTFTKREPRHCCLRHIVTRKTHRGQGLASALLNKMYLIMEENNVDRLRFFADKKSIKFYEKLGYSWHGLSKTGLPFFYGTTDGRLLELPKAQQRYIHTKE